LVEARTVLILEDEVLISYFLEEACALAGWSVVATAANAQAGLENLRTHTPQAALMDVRLGGERDGVQVALEIRKEQPGLKIIFVTGSSEPETIDRMKSADPAAILIKPVDLDVLIDALGSA
jgi:DNA-binding NarL/FixJ family response regulator